MTFCASIHCMDGRIHEPIISYLKGNHHVEYVDFIIEPGVDGILAENSDKAMIDSIIKRIQIAIDVHDIKKIFVTGHYDCLANPVSKETHIDNVKTAISHLQEVFPQIEFIGLWLDENWQADIC